MLWLCLLCFAWLHRALGRTVPVPSCSHATRDSLSLSWTPNPAFKLYYVQLSRNGSLLTRPAALQTTKGSSLHFAGLAANTVYTVALRALPVETVTIAWGPSWLLSEDSVQCRTGTARADAQLTEIISQQTSTQAKGTRFLQVYRISEYSFDVDFLENHNAASIDGLPLYFMSCDVEGDCNPWNAKDVSPHWDACHATLGTLCPGSRGAAFNCMMCAESNRAQLTAVCGNWSSEDTNEGAGSFAIHWWCGIGWPESAIEQGPITEYCVEYQPLEGETRMGEGFSDYLSCNSDEVDGTLGNDPRNPSCICIVWDDRLLSHQTNESWLREDCGVGHVHWLSEPVCNCSGQTPKSPLPQGGNPSLTHVGRSPLYLPYVGIAMAPWVPGRPEFLSGYNYHFPAQGACGEGEEIGTGGCTWRRLPGARMVYGADLLANGWDRKFVPDTETNQSHTRRNIAALQAAFRSLDAFVQPSPCGSTLDNVRVVV